MKTLLNGQHFKNMNSPTIIIAENIPYADKAFPALGKTTILPVSEITPESVKNADALIVRSTTKVNRELLEGSKVRFVGTSTIGFDHVDLEYLKANNIAFTTAAGSNANSVSEYITETILLISKKSGKPLEQSVIAVIGAGNVGSRVAEKAKALGMRCLLNDPPKQRQTNDSKYLPLKEAIKDADYVTMHVPLQTSGTDATLNMANADFFRSMKPGAVFINSSRGKAVNEKDLAVSIDSGHLSYVCLDVWQNEPEIDPEMVRKAFIATPHIAGHSLDGKAGGTAMMFDTLSSWLKGSKRFNPSDFLPEPQVSVIDLTEKHGSDEDLLREAILRIYDIRKDDEYLRRISADKDTGINFKKFRTNYPVRREFYNTTLIIKPDAQKLLKKAQGLGFKTTLKGG